MLLIPDVAQQHTEFRKKQSIAKRTGRKIIMTSEQKTRAKADMYASALKTGKLAKYNPLKLAEHGILYDETAGRCVVSV